MKLQSSCAIQVFLDLTILDLKITKGLELDELKQSIKLNKQEEQINEKS